MIRTAEGKKNLSQVVVSHLYFLHSATGAGRKDNTCSFSLTCWQDNFIYFLVINPLHSRQILYTEACMCVRLDSVPGTQGSYWKLGPWKYIEIRKHVPVLL